MTFFLGVDLGQAADYTALAVVEKVWPGGEPPEEQYAILRIGATRAIHPPKARPVPPVVFHCRHLERMPLGTSYPAVVDRVAAVLGQPQLRGVTQLVIDATGVGRPVVDMIKRSGLDPVPITIHGGDQVSYDHGWRVPKRDLVSIIQVLLQTERLKFAKEIPAVGTLVEELLAFRVKISEAGHDSYGSWREGSHDDMVLALACALWWSERYQGSSAPRHLDYQPSTEGGFLVSRARS